MYIRIEPEWEYILRFEKCKLLARIVCMPISQGGRGWSDFIDTVPIFTIIISSQRVVAT